MPNRCKANLNTLNTEYAGRAFTILKGDYYILNCSEYPSAIVECGFLVQQGGTTPC